MGGWSGTRTLVFAVGLTLTGCAGIDDAGSRMSRTADSFGDGEAATTLTNVIRAGAALPLEFVAPGSYTANRSVSLGIGLPSLTLGPHQTAVQRQVIFGGNGTSTTVGYQAVSSPIVTQEFTNALLAQTSPATLGAYIDQGFSREALFGLFVDSIEVTQPIDGQEYRETLKNDPVRDGRAACPDAGDYNPAVVTADVRRWFIETERIRADPTLSFADRQARIAAAGRAKAATPAGCQYHRLRFYIALALDAGLSVRRDETPDPQPRTVGRFCFSRALAKDSFYGSTRPNQYPGIQGCEGELKPHSDLKVTLSDPAGGVVQQTFEIRLRSPMQMFKYLGALSVDPEAARLAGVTIEARGGRGCGVATQVRGRAWCVPETARPTLEAISVLNLLIRQSTKRDDVPKSVTLTL